MSGSAETQHADAELMRYVQLHERELNAPSMILDHLWTSPIR